MSSKKPEPPAEPRKTFLLRAVAKLGEVFNKEKPKA